MNIKNKGMDFEMGKNNKNTAQLSKKQAEKAERLRRAKRKKINRIIITTGVIIGIIALIIAIVFISKACKERKENPPVDVTYATINFGSYGSVVVRLDNENAPQTVKQFKKLANAGKYNGLELTNVQNGCLYTDFDKDWATMFGEFYKNGVNNTLSHKKGVISMSRDNDYNSANGTFFFTLEDKSTALDKSYASFGEIVSGMDVIEKIAQDVSKNDGSEDYPSVTSVSLEVKKERVD